MSLKNPTEEMPRKREGWLKTIFDSVQCGILIINAETHKIIDANPAAIKMINAPRQQIIGRFCFQYVCPSEAGKCPITDLNQAVDSSECILLNAQGDEVPILKNVSSIKINGCNHLIECFTDISEQKETENDLRENEEKFKVLVEDAPCGLSIMNYDQTFEYCNPKFTEIFGYTIDDIPDKRTWFRKAYPNKKYRNHVKHVWQEDFVECLKRGEIEPRIFRVRCKDGQDKIIHFKAVGLRNGKQILTYEDITEQKKNEEELKFRYEFEKLITQISTDFINLPVDKIDEGIHSALNAIGEFAHVDRSYIFLFSEDGKRLTNTHEWCAKGIKSQKHKVQDVPIACFPWASEKINQNEIIYIPRVDDLPLTAQAEREEFKAHGVKSVISVPVVLGGRCMGALGFDSVREEREWSDETISLLKIVGNIISNILDRKRIEKSLRENEARLRTTIESLPFDFFSIDESGRYNMVNATSRMNWGDIVGKRPEDICQDRNTLKIWQDNNRRAFTGEVVKGEVSFKIQGQDKSIYNIISPIYEDGNIKGILGVNIDITERKKAETLLKEGEERLELALKGADLGVWDRDFRTGKIIGNERTFEIFGYSHDEMELTLDMWESHIHPDDRPRASEKQKSHLAGKTPFFEAEYRLRTKSGEWKWILSRGKVVNRDKDGKPLRSTGTLLDITHRKMAEKDLLDSEKKFKALAEYSPNMIFINKKSRIAYVNKKCEELTGYTKEEFYSPDFDYMTLIAPEYRNTFSKNFSKHMKGEEVPPIEYAIITKNGIRIEAILTTKLIDYEKDKAILGIVTDITDRKNAEQRLREERDKAQQFLDIAGVMIIVIDKDRKVRLINKKGSQILGYDEKEIIGKDWIEAFIPKRFRNQIEVLAEKLRAGESESFEYFENPVLIKSGEERLISWHNVLLRDKQGIITGLLCSGEDITERKQAEEALRKSENKYRTLVESIPQKIFLKDTNSVYISCNENYAKDLKIKAEEISGKTDYDFFPKALADKYRRDDKRIIKSGKTEGLEERYIQDGRKSWIHILKTPVRDEGGHITGILSIFWDITERKKSQEAFEKFTKELAKQKKALEEKNIALREVLGQLAVEKSKMREDIITNIDELILPIVKRIQLKGAAQEYMTLLERNLKDITSSFGQKITEKTAKLTPKEIEICNMLKNGLTSKEISNLLNISFQTVVKHRKNIRKKLSISKKDINLYSFLQQL